MNWHWWHTITYLGDSALTVPGACIVAAWLLINGAWALALRWLFAFGAAMSLVVVSKLLFMGWDVYPAVLDFTGMSGHTASATMLYTTMAVLLARGYSRRTQWSWLGLSVLLVTCIAISRFVVKAHSESEILSGLLTGALASWWFARHVTAYTQQRLRWRYALLLLAALLYGGNGQRPAPTQGMLHVIAMHISGHDFVYMRSKPL